MIRALVRNGIWDKLDVLYIFAAPDSTTACLNLVSSSFTGLISGHAPTFTADRGFTGDGASTYVDSQFVPSTAGGKMTLNYGHMSVWDLTSRAASSSNEMGSINTGATTQSIMLVRFTGNLFAAAMNNISNTTIAVSDSKGHFIINRLNDASNIIGYINGVNQGSTAKTSVALPNRSIYVLARQAAAGGPQSFSSDQCAAVTIGGGLTDGEAANLYTAILTYLRAVGAI